MSEVAEISLNYLNKSQQKIIEFGKAIANGIEDQYEFETELRYSISLINFNESLSHNLNDWGDDDILKRIAYFNRKHKLNDIPFLELQGYQSPIIIVGGDGSGSVGDVTQADLDALKQYVDSSDSNIHARIDLLTQQIALINLDDVIPQSIYERLGTLEDASHSHNNKEVLDQLNSDHINEIASAKTHREDSTKHVTSEKKTYWDNKADKDDHRFTDARNPTSHEHPISEVDGLELELQNIKDSIPTEVGTGQTPNIQIGTVTEGEEPAVELDASSTPENPVFNFRLVRGANGESFKADVWGDTPEERFNATYNTPVNNEIFGYLSIGTSELYFRDYNHPATDPLGWSDPIVIHSSGWLPLIGTYSASETSTYNIFIDWFGGTGPKPARPVPEGADPDAIIYIGQGGYTMFEDQATNIKGNPGQMGVGLSEAETKVLIDFRIAALNLEQYVTKIEGKGLSTNDLTNGLLNLLNLLKDNGSGDLFLANDGIYKKASASIINDIAAAFDKTYSSAKINQLLAAVSSGLIPKGNWDATSVDPPSEDPHIGWFWIVNIPGTTQLGNVTSWDIGDYVWWNGTEWLKVPAYEKGLIGDKEVDLTLLDADHPILVYNPSTDKFEASEIPGITDAEQLKIDNLPDNTTEALAGKVDKVEGSTLVSAAEKTSWSDKYTKQEVDDKFEEFEPGTSVQQLVDVNVSFPVNTPLGFDFSNGGVIAQASETVEHIMTVVSSGKASTPGAINNRQLPVGAYYLNETTGSLTLTRPTTGVVRLAYLQGQGVGIDVWHAGYVISDESEEEPIVLDIATEAEAIAGTNNEKAMSPLRTMQSIAARQGIGLMWNELEKRFDVNLTSYFTYNQPGTIGSVNILSKSVGISAYDGTFQTGFILNPRHAYFTQNGFGSIFINNDPAEPSFQGLTLMDLRTGSANKGWELNKVPSNPSDLSIMPKQWIEQQIANITSGAGNKIFDPVQNITALKAINTTSAITYPDKGIINVEDAGLYRLDRESSSAVDDNFIIAPTTGAGRWIKLSSQLTSHDSLSNVLGGTYHLTLEKWSIAMGSELAFTMSRYNAINANTAKVSNIDREELEFTNLTFGSTVTIAIGANIKHVKRRLTLTGNVTTLNLSGLKNGDRGTIYVLQNATGGWNITKPANHRGDFIINDGPNEGTELWFEYNGTHVVWRSAPY